MALVKKKVDTAPGKTVTVEVPEDWTTEQIRSSMQKRGLFSEDEGAQRMVEKSEYKGTDISKDPLIHAREMKRTTGGPRTYTDRPSELDEGSIGFLPWLLEKIDRPRSAVVGALQGWAEEDETAWTNVKQAFKGEEHRMVGDYIFEKVSEEAKKPIHERNPLVMAPWISAAYEQAPEETLAATSTVGGLFFDIGLDPITYTGIGATKKGKNLDVFFSLQKEGIEVTDPKMVEYINKLMEKDSLHRTNTMSGRLSEGQSRMRVFGVPIPGYLSGKAVGLTEQMVEKMKATKAGDDLWRKFSTRHGLGQEIEGFADIEERFKNIATMARYHSVKDNKPLAKSVRELSKKTKVKESDIMKLITEGVERGGVGAIRTANLTKPELKALFDDETIQKAVRDLSEKNKFQLSLEQSAGVRVSEVGSMDADNLMRLDEAIMYAVRKGDTTAVNPITGRAKSLLGLKKDRKELADQVARQEQLSYMKHAMTPKARKIVMNEKGATTKSATGGRVYSLQHASTLERRFKDMSIDEINTLAREGKLPGYEGTKFPSGFFHDDPAVVQTIRDIHHRKAMALADMVDTTKTRFGVSLDDLREKHGKSLTSEELLGREGIEGYRLVKNPKLQALTKGHAFPEEIADRLETHYGAIFDREVTDEFLKTYDGIQNWWKAYTLGIFPAYHFRNAVGNVWNNYVTGTKNPEVYGTAMGIQRGKKGNIRTVDGRDISYDEIRQHLDELGVHNRGFIATDIEQAIKSELGGAKWASLSKDAKAIRIGQTVGTSIENNARIAKFVDEIQKGKGFFDAGQSVKHALFDYQDLTKFEKGTMKRLAPFYTWSRKNIPLQLEQMIKHPGRYKAIDTLRMNIEATNHRPEDPNEYVLHDWMLENYPTRIRWNEVDMPDGTKKKLPQYFMLGGWLPAADVWKMSAAPSQLIVDNVTPMIKVWGEPLSGVDWFTWNELDSDIKQDFLGMRLNQKQIKALRNLRVLTVADELASNFGMYEKTPSLIPNPETEKTAEETLLSFLTGIRTYTADLEKAQMRKLQELGGKEREMGSKFRRQMFYGTTPKEFKGMVDELTTEQINDIKKLLERSETRQKEERKK